MSERTDLSRRDAIKKGLALGTIGYVAPMIIGSASPASAQSLSGNGCSRATVDCANPVTCSNQLSDECACVPAVAGGLACIQVGDAINFDPECCDSSADCDNGWLCVDFANVDLSECGGAPSCQGHSRVCWPTCGALVS